MNQEFCLGLAIGLGVLSFSSPVMAQITSDGTLSIPTVVPNSVNGRDFLINNGTRSGNNLFHSFSQFSVPTNGSAIFNNATDIQTIFGRITGSQGSNIDGILKTQGSTNLFLMNPNGIIFGPNAQLQLGGSFLGTTATGIKFEDNLEFNTVNATPALLSVKVPIGLQMGSNPANIQVNHTGHQITAPFLQMVRRGNTALGLSVAAGKTLALVGGDVTLTGGLLNAPDGRVELGAVTSPSLVALSANPLGWTLDYGNVTQFGNIRLGQRSLVEASNTGAIRLVGNNISLNDASLLLLDNPSTQAAIGVEMRAVGVVEFVGATPNATLTNGGIASGIISDARSSGTGGDIAITADRILSRDNGGILRVLTFGSANSGNITFNANRIILRGGNQNNSQIEVRTIGKGNGGKLAVNTGQLILQDAGLISNVNNGSGNAGDILINASESVSIGPNKIQPSIIASSSVSMKGDAGNVTINTPRLTLQGGALISSSTYGVGNAGFINLNISESLDLSGFGLNLATNRIEPSTIRTSGILLPEPIRRLFRLPDQITGSSGGIVINTPNLQISQGALLSVSHDSLGNAGKITVNADSLKLNTQGKITATTASGEGGNITLNLRELLLMRNGSVINTEARGTGSGGNIILNSPIIVGFENSDIIANAKGGKGGNINIMTQEVLGLKFRNTRTPRTDLTNDVTASSEFSIDGNVKVNMIGIDPANSLNALPVNITDSSRQITDRCGNPKGGSFVTTGRGGIPQTPMKTRKTDRTWNDFRTTTLQASAIVNPMAENYSQPIVEASALHIDETGSISLITPKITEIQSMATCGMTGSIGAQ